MLTPPSTAYREFEDSFRASLASLPEEQREIVVRNAISIFYKTAPKVTNPAFVAPVPPRPALPPVVSAPTPAPVISEPIPKSQPIPTAAPIPKPRPIIRPTVSITPSQWKRQDAQFMALTRDTRSLVTQRVSNGDSVGDWYDIRLHLPLLYGIAKGVNWLNPGEPPKVPPLMMEIGVRHGISTIALLMACRETGGSLLSLEIDPEWAQDATDCVTRMGLQDYWQLQVADSAQYELPKDTLLDVLWIDGDHEERAVSRDFLRFSPFVRRGGYILFHDYYQFLDCAPGDSGVQNVVEAARMTGQYEVMVFAFSHGLAVLRVI